MRMNFGRSAPDAEAHPHHHGHKIERFEGAADLLIVGLIVVLGLAMLIGLLTASGKTYW